MLEKQPTEVVSPKSATIALLLCVFLGIFGAHRFYVGKVRSGLLMLFTLGGLGLWMVVDTVMIACGEFKDKHGRALILVGGDDHKGKIILGILAIFASFLIFLLGLGAIRSCFTSDKLTSPITSQLRAIQKGNLEKAYLYGSVEFREATTFAAFKEFVDSYSVIKHNDGITITYREPDEDKPANQVRSVDGVVHSEDNSMPVSYKLVKEDGSYKILNMKLTSDEDSESVDGGFSADASSVLETKSTQNMTYSDTVGNYTIDYPDNWFHENTTKYSTVFSGKKGTPAYITTVTVQVIPMEKAGGIYNSAKAVVDDLKIQIEKETTDIKWGKEGDAELPSSPEKYKGLYFEVSYKYQNIAMKKMQYIIISPDERTAYSWGYTTTAGRYDNDLPIAQVMFDSLKIN